MAIAVVGLPGGTTVTTEMQNPEYETVGDAVGYSWRNDLASAPKPGAGAQRLVESAGGYFLAA
jgi:hypothetical protein